MLDLKRGSNMAKFTYRMQNILDIKYKLENQAKQEYQEVAGRLRDAEKILEELKMQKSSYIAHYKELTANTLDIMEIEHGKEAIDIMELYIVNQENVIKTIEFELEQARNKLKDVMQDRKVHEKLKDNEFEEFLIELNKEEMKEIDEVVSYQYNNVDSEV